MDGVSESQKRLSVQRGRVGSSRSTPNRRRAWPGGEHASHLHLENDGFSEAVGGWSPDLCIQLASITSRRQRFSEEGALNLKGAVAQLGERLICIQEVAGSIPTSSTIIELIFLGRLLDWSCRCGPRWLRRAGFSSERLKTHGPVAQLARAHP